MFIKNAQHLCTAERMFQIFLMKMLCLVLNMPPTMSLPLTRPLSCSHLYIIAVVGRAGKKMGGKYKVGLCGVKRIRPVAMA